MNRPEVYHKSVQILYDAYFNDTLKHGQPCGCAVGNIIAKSCRIELEILDGETRVGWVGANVHWWYALSERRYGEPITISGYNKEEGKRQIESTGYDIDEIHKIELAFELAEIKKSEEENMFNGLVAVLEALKEIHEVEDADLIESNHKRFKEHHERKLQTV